MSERKIYKGFKPEWEQVPPPAGAFRSILKWGDPNEFKEPNERLFKLMKDKLALTDADFAQKQADGHEPAPETLVAPSLAQPHLSFFESVCGKEQVSVSGYDRLSVAYGKTMYDLYRLWFILPAMMKLCRLSTTAGISVFLFMCTAAALRLPVGLKQCMEG